MKVIIGIDPGLGHTGWGVIKIDNNKLSFIDCGKISSNPKQPLPNRLLTISNGLNKVISKYSPDECAIETTFVNNNPLSSLKLGHARGAAILTAAIAGLYTYEYPANLVKKTIVGVGHAGKQQILMMVKTLLPKSIITSEDAADALAIAICHTQHSKFNSAK
jgi:crossover junction endodeoxyribonuclease RuvC